MLRRVSALAVLVAIFGSPATAGTLTLAPAPGDSIPSTSASSFTIVDALDDVHVTVVSVAAHAAPLAIDAEIWTLLTAPQPGVPADLDRLALLTDPPATDRHDRIWPVTLNF